MLRMIIADDEKAIRESIDASVDWRSMGIEIVGVARNGSEAYDMVLDENPDIVLTDICMPGLSGLELISRMAQTASQTQFIILSGYSDFKYAQEAMQFGVRHYLVKPCALDKLIDVIEQVKDECYRRSQLTRQDSERAQLFAVLRQNMTRSALIELIAGERTTGDVIEKYAPFLDFDHTCYDLFELAPFPQAERPNKAEAVLRCVRENIPASAVHSFCARDSLLFFFETCDSSYGKLNEGLENLCRTGAETWQVRHRRFSSLREVFGETASRKTENITMVDGFLEAALKKPELLSADMRQLIEWFGAAGTTDQRLTMLDSVSDRQREGELPGLDGLDEQNGSRKGSAVDEVISYVRAHIDDPGLSLKWLAENWLFMNADYLSKQFIRQTGEKFSTFLNRTRIEEAKSLLQRKNTSHVYDVAEKVGLGNSPQYFSQLFKKATGQTPTEYSAR